MIKERRAILKSGCERISKTRSDTMRRAERRRRLDDELTRRRILFIEDGLELRPLNRPAGDDALERVEMPAGFRIASIGLLVLRQGPYFDLENLERVEHGHRHGVRALVR